jgi:drug/metabolite transporter (DMT)-like permease
MVALGAWLLLNEPLVKRTLAGLFLSVAGVVALSLAGDATGLADNPLWGNVLELFAMASAAVNMLIVKRLCDRYNPWLLTALQVLAGTLFFSPGLFFLIRGAGVTWTMHLVLAIVFLGGLVTLGAFGLYNWAMSRIPASRAAVFINMVPVAAVVFGWTMLGESLSLVQCVAAAGVILGVAISQRGA